MPAASFANLTVSLVALSFLTMGFTALIRPAHIGHYFDTVIGSVDGRNEVRAVYGGFGIAMALVLVSTFVLEPLRLGVLTCTAVALLGMAVGRLIGAFVETPGRWPWIFCAVEVVAGCALALSAAAER